MKATTGRQKAVLDALRTLIPLAPMADFEPIVAATRARHLRTLAPRDAAFLITVAHIRHRHTEYDALLEEGYDTESARHFVLDDINATLRDWGSPRQLSPDDPTESDQAL